MTSFTNIEQWWIGFALLAAWVGVGLILLIVQRDRRRRKKRAASETDPPPEPPILGGDETLEDLEKKFDRRG